MPNPQRGALIERLGSWITGQPAPPPSGQDLTRAITRSVPTELISRIRQRPFDPKVIELFQPDSIARAKGWSAYETMLDDSQIRAVTTLKRYAPTSNGWKLTPHDETPMAAEIADFCRDNLLAMEKTLEEITGQVLESTFTGMSISESLYRVERRGMYKNKIMLSDVQTRPPSMVDVDFDGSGRVVGILQSDTYGGWNNVGVHPFKFVVHTWHGRYGSPYGRGDGRACYRHWWSKDMLMRWWSAYMDKFGSPSMIGRQTQSMSQEEVNDFQTLLASVQHEGFSVLPADWQIDWLFPPGGGGNAQAFLTAIEWHDGQMAKAVLGSTLSTDQATGGTGTFAQAKVHADTRDLLLRRVKTEAETTIVTRQILRRLVRLNYGHEAAMRLTPKFIFSPPNLDEMKDLATIIQGLVTAQVISAEEPWIRERLFIPGHAEVHDATAEIAKANAEKQSEVAGASAQAQLDLDSRAASHKINLAQQQAEHGFGLDQKRAAMQQALSERSARTQFQLGQKGADMQTKRDRVKSLLGAALAQRGVQTQHQLGQQGADAQMERENTRAQFGHELNVQAQQGQFQLGQKGADLDQTRSRNNAVFNSSLQQKVAARSGQLSPEQQNTVRNAVQSRLQQRATKSKKGT